MRFFPRLVFAAVIAAAPVVGYSAQLVTEPCGVTSCITGVREISVNGGLFDVGFFSGSYYQYQASGYSTPFSSYAEAAAFNIELATHIFSSRQYGLVHFPLSGYNSWYLPDNQSSLFAESVSVDWGSWVSSGISNFYHNAQNDSALTAMIIKSADLSASSPEFSMQWAYVTPSAALPEPSTSALLLAGTVALMLINLRSRQAHLDDK